METKEVTIKAQMFAFFDSASMTISPGIILIQVNTQHKVSTRITGTLEQINFNTPDLPW